MSKREQSTCSQLNRTVKVSEEDAREIAEQPLKQARETFENLERWRNRSIRSDVRI